MEQMAIYATFNHQGTIKEHYVGIIPISKLVGNELSAPNVMRALIKLFDDINVSITKARYSCMDTTNVNSGNRGGLKRYLLHEVPMALWVGCGNHKLALCFKHLLGEFPFVADLDTTLLSLWRFFHYRPLAVNFLQEIADAYNENQTLPVCPSTTRWTSHGRACKALYEGYQMQFGALNVCFNERCEPEALGIFMSITSDIFIATLFMLHDVFDAIAPLNLVLQTNNKQLCLADVKTYVQLTKSALEKLSTGERKWFTQENFDNKVCKAREQMLSLPPSSRLRSADENFEWERFAADVFQRFVLAFIEELDNAFGQLEFWMSFAIFDPRKLPERKEEIINYGKNELQELGEFYSTKKVDKFKGKVNTQDLDIDLTALKAEWQLFKTLIFEKHQSYHSKVDKDISRADPENHQELIKKRERYTPCDLWNDLKHDNVVKEIYPNCIYLLHLLLIFPISIACVERLFSRMKLIKTRLRNQMKQATMDSILRSATETPSNGFTDEDFDFFVDELKRLNPNMRLKL